MSFTVAVIGRPNVGKSTLFNRLTGKRLAIVDNIPGVTRDRREGDGGIAGLDFTVIDTAGLDDAGDGSLESRMREQTERALDDADVALFLIDARAGVTPLDEHFADWLRRHETPVIVVANKCEGGAGQGGLLETYGLGLGDPVALSAEHGEGLDGLYQALLPFASPGDSEETAAGGEAATRDSISVSWDWEGHPIRLIDTAGLRRKARVTGKLEGLSVGDALRAIRFAEVVVLTVDATLGLEKQDLSIARLVIEEGRALVLAVNKWDLAKDRKAVMSGIEDRLMRSLPQVRGIPVIPCSAKTGKGMDKLLPAVFSVYETWNRRVETGELNRWLAAMTEAHPPPVAKGRRIKIRYMTQAKTRPPTFIVFASRKDALPESYVRYLINGLRESFDLPAVPIRVHLRAGKNPYVKSKRKGKGKG